MLNGYTTDMFEKVGTSTANSHYGKQQQLQTQPECKATNLSSLQNAKNCFPKADHEDDSIR